MYGYTSALAPRSHHIDIYLHLCRTCVAAEMHSDRRGVASTRSGGSSRSARRKREKERWRERNFTDLFMIFALYHHQLSLSGSSSCALLKVARHATHFRRVATHLNFHTLTHTQKKTREYNMQKAFALNQSIIDVVSPVDYSLC